VVLQLMCWTTIREVQGSTPGQGRNLDRVSCSTFAPLTNSAMASTLTGHCQWEDETVRERTGRLPSYAERNSKSV